MEGRFEVQVIGVFHALGHLCGFSLSLKDFVHGLAAMSLNSKLCLGTGR